MDNLDVNRDYIELETESESMSLNATYDTTIFQSKLNSKVNLTNREDLEKEKILSTFQNVFEETTLLYVYFIR